MELFFHCLGIVRFFFFLLLLLPKCFMSLELELLINYNKFGIRLHFYILSISNTFRVVLFSVVLNLCLATIGLLFSDRIQKLSGLHVENGINNQNI